MEDWYEEPMSPALRRTHILITNHILWTITSRLILVTILPNKMIRTCFRTCCQTSFSKDQITWTHDARWTTFVAVTMELAAQTNAEKNELIGHTHTLRRMPYHVEHWPRLTIAPGLWYDLVCSSKHEHSDSFLHFNGSRLLWVVS